MNRWEPAVSERARNFDCLANRGAKLRCTLQTVYFSIPGSQIARIIDFRRAMKTSGFKFWIPTARGSDGNHHHRQPQGANGSKRDADLHLG
jgi:hypothetical protein